MTEHIEKKPSPAGRPPKFREARRPVTVTLPERVLHQLRRVSPDRARAIVKCVEAVAGAGERALKPVELVEVLPGKALIVIGPSRVLKQIGWLHLAEIAPTRYLLVLPSGTPIESLEVEIRDLMENLAPDEESERALLSELHNLMGHQRRHKTVSKAELIFVEIPSKR